MPSEQISRFTICTFRLLCLQGDVGTSAEAAKGAAMAAASGDLGCGIALTEAGSSCSAQVKLSIQVLDSPNQQHS